MDKFELDNLRHLTPHEPGLTFEECTRWFALTDKDAFTLLYGYDVNRNTWHVYVKDGEIHRFVYQGGDGDPVVHSVSYASSTEWAKASDLAPNKRLYPSRCYFPFAVLLQSKGVGLVFTTFDDQMVAQDAERFPDQHRPMYGEVY